MGMGIKDLLALPNHWLDGQEGKAHEKGPGRVSDPNGGRRSGRPPMMLFLPLLNGDVPYPIILKITASPCRKKMSAWQLQYSTRLGHLEYSKTLRVRLNGLIRTDCLLLFLPLETVNSALCVMLQHNMMYCAVSAFTQFALRQVSPRPLSLEWRLFFVLVCVSILGNIMSWLSSTINKDSRRSPF